MPDVLLTHGYFLQDDAHERKIMKPYPPLGILHLSACLKQRGFHVRVYDATFGSMAGFRTILEQERPPVVGIYCTLMTKFAVLEMIRMARLAGSKVVLGGPEPAGYAGEYLACGADVVVFGEGETALEELLPALAKRGAHSLDGIAGIAFRGEDGSVIRTAARPQVEDLDSLPDPDREAIDIDRYLAAWRTHHGMGSVSLICARGCPYHCTCAVMPSTATPTAGARHGAWPPKSSRSWRATSRTNSGTPMTCSRSITRGSLNIPGN
jgi:anaerobic magnesium-protoporphyrin IX monomethyl ester cyclase